jgi:hypothetical protein
MQTQAGYVVRSIYRSSIVVLWCKGDRAKYDDRLGLRLKRTQCAFLIQCLCVHSVLFNEYYFA